MALHTALGCHGFLTGEMVLPALACRAVLAAAVLVWSSSPSPDPAGEQEQLAPASGLPQAAEFACPILAALPESRTLLGFSCGCQRLRCCVGINFLQFPALPQGQRDLEATDELPSVLPQASHWASGVSVGLGAGRGCWG